MSRSDSRDAGTDVGAPAALARGALVVALATLVLTWALRLVVERAMGVPLWEDFWLRDWAGNLALTLVAWALVRRVVPALAYSALVIAGLQLINATKLLVLGVPGAPEDFANLANLYRLADGPAKLAVVAVGLVPIVLLAALVRWRSAATWVVLAGLGAGIELAHARSDALVALLDARFGHSSWNAAGNFRSRGLVLHLVQESLRGSADDEGPSPEDVELALAGLPGAEATLPYARTPRNVHVIVLESFFDPVTLGPEWVPEDPFPPELRELLAETGHSAALVPTFGGYTANAEFEALCGFPVTENAVFFEGGLLRNAPCLPRVLAAAGYRTVAAHPNVPQFWNRTVAYRLAGFERFWSIRDFDTTDSVDSFLLDGSLYDQVSDRLAASGDGPTFSYTLTYHGHLPYPTSEAYPERVDTLGDVPKLQGYANQVWYKSRHLVARIERLRAEDPDALIVAFGDHLPFLNFSYGVYTDALGLPVEREDFTAGQLEFLTSTPLIVIDGRNGPLDVGRVPLYRLPALILELLGASEHGAFAWAENPDGTLYRPLYGMQYQTPADAPAASLASARLPDAETGRLSCVPDGPDGDDPACEAGLAWRERVRTLIDDLFGGRQFSLGHETPGETLGDG